MTGWSRQPVAPGAAIPILLSAVGVANLMFRILANLEFGEGLEQSSLSEHGEDGLLRVVNQLFEVALYVGTHQAAMRNSGSRRPDFGICYDRAVDVPQGDLCCWSCETHATVLPIWDRRSLLWTSGTRSLRTKLGFAPRLFANSAEESWETLFRSANARLSMI